MLIYRSLGRKLSATAIVVLGFVFMYEAKVMDFLDIPRLIQSPSAADEISIPDQSNHLRLEVVIEPPAHAPAPGGLCHRCGHRIRLSEGVHQTGSSPRGLLA